MTYKEEKELLRLTRENNYMLKKLLEYFAKESINANTENANDFMMNLVANLLSTSIERRI